MVLSGTAIIAWIVWLSAVALTPDSSPAEMPRETSVTVRTINWPALPEAVGQPSGLIGRGDPSCAVSTMTVHEDDSYPG
jgi:hypothetical protein